MWIPGRGIRGMCPCPGSREAPDFHGCRCCAAEAAPRLPVQQMSRALAHPVTVSANAVSNMNLQLMAAQ
jgi:hypothetical protein